VLKKDRLAKLEALYSKPEVTAGFPSQQACLTWANQVAPLLNFNALYHEPFLHYLQIISLPLSTHTVGPAFQNMLNQVQMAVVELKQEVESEAIRPAPPVQTSPSASESKGPSIWKLEPNVYGIGVNLPEIWKRIKSKWAKKNP
jgi:hypothetical protein